MKAAGFTTRSISRTCRRRRGTPCSFPKEDGGGQSLAQSTSRRVPFHVTAAAPPAAIWATSSNLTIGASSWSRRSRLFGRTGVGLEFEQVAGLAAEHSADRLQRREADRARLAGLEDREVGEGDVDLLGKFRQRHPPLVKKLVELDRDRHHTVPSRSSRINVPSANTRARTKVRITASQPLTEKPASR